MPKKNNNNKIKLYERVAKLEVSDQETKNDIKEIKTDIRSIKDNHIKDIYKKLDSIKNRQIGVLVSMVMILIGVIISIIVK